MQHGAAPDERLVSGIKKTYGNDFETVGINWRDLIFAHHLRLFVSAKHEGDVRAIDVTVKQSDFVTHFAERDCEVDCEGGLADSARAGTDGDDGIDAG